MPVADPKLEALSRVPLFARCTRRELEFIGREGDEVNVKAGKTLLKQGRPGDTFYIQLEGKSEVEVDGRKRRVLGPGDFFGEISMVDRGVGTATVRTVSDGRLFVMSHAQFRDAVKANDAIMVKVLLVMGERLRADLAIKR